MNWLLTGGCGFIGTNLVKNLITEGGHYIRIVDNLAVGSRADLAKVCRFTEVDPSQFSSLNRQSSSSFPAELITGDILDEQLALKVAEGMDVIVHLAANTGVGPSVENPRLDCVTNVIGTLNYLEAARHNKVRRYIFASSGAPIGECEPPIHEELAPHPVSPYGASKLACEGYCSAYFRTFGIETIALRFGNVYGPLSKHKSSVIAKFIRLALKGETWEIYGDGKQTRDFIFVDDLIRAIRLAATTEGIGGEIFQIATNSETNVSELAQKLVFILSEWGIKEIRIDHITPRLGDVRRNFSNIMKAKYVLGWELETSIENGLKKTVEWFLAENIHKIIK